MRSTLPLAISLALTVPWSAAAQELEDSASVAAELARLNATLSRIATLLEAQVEGQDLALAMRRIELAAAKASETESLLRSAQAERSSIEDQQISTQTEAEHVAAQIASDSVQLSEEQLRALAKDFEAREERLETRMREIDRRIVELGNRLAEERREIRDWQDLVDRRLESGQ